VGDADESALFKCKKHKRGKLRWVSNGGERY